MTGKGPTMYKKILIPLENSKADRAILHHIKPLARLMGASLLLMHVADGWVARNYEQLKLAESEEMKTDRAYLAGVAKGHAGGRIRGRAHAGDGRTFR